MTPQNKADEQRRKLYEKWDIVSSPNTEQNNPLSELRERIQKNILNKKCFWCGKNRQFQCWQFYNINKQTLDKHDDCWWCSNNCLSKAEGSSTKISNVNYGKLHTHKTSNDCLGEFEI